MEISELIMSKKATFIFLFILPFTIQFSCQKGCQYPADSVAGDIIPDSYVLGGNTDGNKSVHFTATSQYDLQVSFDKGQNYEPVNFNKYTVLNFPVTVSCNTHFDREVKIDNAAQKVTYTLTSESCPDCEDQYTIDNWILTKKFPASYQVVYSHKKN